MHREKILVILGPTATGKSDLAVKLARKFGGEVVSADSRQVYRGLDIGTGKITKKEMRGIPHHLLDVASPKRQFTAADYQKLAERAVRDILKRGKLPIICGGTGFYIDAVLNDTLLPDVPPDPKLRKQLDKKSLKELQVMLEKLDPRRYEEIDKQNPRRLIRAIEIARAKGIVPPLQTVHFAHNREKNEQSEILKIGLNLPKEIHKEKIKKRLTTRIKNGMIKEVQRLHSEGLSWKRMEDLGLEYRYLARYLQGKISKEDMVEKLATETWRYAKRQMMWFKRDKNIKWFSLAYEKKILKLVKDFI